MPGIPQIRSIEFLKRPAQGRAEVMVRLEDGSSSSFIVAAPSQPGEALAAAGLDFSFETPVLFVSSLDEAAVGEAVAAMAADIGGFWLRYYNTLGDPKAAKAKRKA